jgi:hypothetical protein
MISQSLGTVLYVATGSRFFHEAVESATSLRRFCPHIRITVFTDKTNSHPVFNRCLVLRRADYDYRDKIRGLLAFNGTNGLLLDTDTLVTDNISQLFELLTRFDLAVAHASWRFSIATRRDRFDGAQLYAPDACPRPFCELNTGVLVFRNSEKWRTFVRSWRAQYHRQLLQKAIIPANEQPAFRLSLWKSGLRFYVLPPEYNYRCDFPAYAGSKVAVLHGRHPQINELASKINLRIGARVSIPKPLKMSKQGRTS